MERDARLEALSDAIERGADETVVDGLVALSGEFAAHIQSAQRVARGNRNLPAGSQVRLSACATHKRKVCWRATRST